MGNVTIQGDITATVPGNAIGGAVNVSTGGVLYGTAAGVAGTSANLTYDSATSRIVNAGQLAITGGTPLPPSGVNGLWMNFFGNIATIQAIESGSFGRQLDLSGNPLLFRNSQSAAEVARFATTTGNFLLGTTTDDGTNRLQVAGSIIVNAGNALRLQNPAANQFASLFLNASPAVELNYPMSIGSSSALNTGGAITLGVHNGTPTTGVTQLVVRAGAGQSSTNLQTWQNSGGTALSSILPTGQIRMIGVTVASLPAAAAGNAGAIATVTDANATTIGTTVAGGGANTVLVWSNGTNWRIYAN